MPTATPTPIPTTVRIVRASRAGGILSLTEAVDRGVGLAVAGYSIPDAASHVVQMGLSQDAIDALVIDGLAVRIKQGVGAINGAAKSDAAAATATSSPARSTSRSGGGPARSGRKQPKAKPSAARFWYIDALADTSYADSSGNRKPLLAFSLADVTALLKSTSATRAGFERLEVTLELAKKALKDTGAKTVEKLPAADIERIALAFGAKKPTVP